MKRRYEVRARVCATGQDTPEPPERFFFRRNAEQYCWEMNTYRLIMGHKSFTFYVHDTKSDD